MIFRRRSIQSRHASQIPPGNRVYAVGDVHGRSDLLARLLDQIDADDANRDPADTTIVFLGDLINRGSDSAGVIQLVRDRAVSGRHRIRLIRGNHEEVFLLAAGGSARATRALVEMGGDETLCSFGISPDEAQNGTFDDLASLLNGRLPTEMIDFIATGEDVIIIGDYAFVHAGIRPGVALSEQETADLRWIRGDFLASERDHGKVIVHGHTISERVEQKPNRIGLDTGAYASGRLSAIGLEGNFRWTLDTAKD